MNPLKLLIFLDLGFFALQNNHPNQDEKAKKNEWNTQKLPHIVGHVILKCNLILFKRFVEEPKAKDPNQEDPQ